MIRIKIVIALALVSIFILPAAVVAGQKAKRPPNVVIVFVDDMGYADVGCFGGKIKTPNIDRMAKEGVKFTDFYVSQAVCSASRSSLLTGCYNVRVGIMGALGPRSKHGLGQQEMTIAELLKQLGYATGIFGKWHLGHLPQHLPTNHGFDEYFGLPYSNDMWPYHPGVLKLPLKERLKRWPHLPLVQGKKIINPMVTAKDQKNLTTWYTEKAVDFINRNKDRPFFCYLPHSMPHVPLFVSDARKGKSAHGLFGDVIREIDWSVGQVLDALKKNGIDDNTIVIFTSDNGPWLSYGTHGGSAGPLREGKGTSFEGGVRVSCVMRWPGHIPAGHVCREPAMTIDILPSLAKITGAKLPKHKIDGKNIWPLMSGEKGAKSPHEALYFYWGKHLQCVRSGKWKLHFPHNYRTLNGRKGGTGGIPVNYDTGKIGLSLFDLTKDIGETKNVATANQDVVQRLQMLADKIRKELGDAATGQKGTGVRPVAQFKKAGKKSARLIAPRTFSSPAQIIAANLHRDCHAMIHRLCQTPNS